MERTLPRHTDRDVVMVNNSTLVGGVLMYPDERALEYIDEYDVTLAPATELWRFIEGTWNDQYGLFNKVSSFDGAEGTFIHMSTGGWSGNEEIIQAMRNNKWFWATQWVQSKRGGHYVFEVKDIPRKEEKTDELQTN